MALFLRIKDLCFLEKMAVLLSMVDILNIFLDIIIQMQHFRSLKILILCTMKIKMIIKKDVYEVLCLFYATVLCSFKKVILWFTHTIRFNSKLIICRPGKDGLINIRIIVSTRTMFG